MMVKLRLKSGSGDILRLTLAGLIALALSVGCAAQKGTEAPQESAVPFEVESIKVDAGDSQDRVVIMVPQSEGTIPVPYSAYQWKDPVRVVIDLTGVTPGDVPSTIPVANDLIQDINVKSIASEEQGARPQVRVIINLTHDAQYTAVREGQLIVVSLDKTPVTGTDSDLFPLDKIAVEDSASNELTAAKPEPWVWGGATGPDEADSAASSAPAKNLTGIEVAQEGELTRVSLRIDGNLGDYSAFTLDKPDRLVVDLYGMQNQSQVLRKDINDQGIGRVRVGQHEDKVRLVFDAEGEMPHFRFDKDTSRLVVTFSKSVDISASPEVAVAVSTETSGVQSQPEDVAASVPEAPAGVEWPVMDVAQDDQEWGGATGDEVQPDAIAPVQPSESSDVPRSSEVGDWPTPPPAPVVVGRQKPGIAYIDQVKFDYTAEASIITIRADRPLRRDQWEMFNNADQNVSERTMTVFIQNAQLSQDQQRTFDTTEFASPIDIFSVYQSPEKLNEVALVIVLNSWAASKWDSYDNKLVIKYENFPGSLGIGGQPSTGFKGPQGEDLTTGTPGDAKNYTGAMISLDVKNMDILDVLRMIAESSGMNIVVSDKVRGRVTMRLDNVPWDQALDIILQSRQLKMKQVGNVIRIAPRTEFDQEELQEAKAIENRKKYENMEIRIIPINYLQAQDLQKIVTPLLTQGRGRVNPDRRTNSLVVMDRVEVLDQIYAVIRQLDRPTRQVLIEARIVEATEGVTREIGVSWGANANIGPSTGTPTGMTFPNSIQVGGATLGGAANAPIVATGASSGGGAVGINFGHLTNVVDLDMLLRALEAKEKIKIISSPRVLTLTDETAIIQQGVSIPYPPPSSTAGTSIGWTFVEASLRLEVTPHVAADNSIVMDVKAANNEPVTISGSQTPGVSKKEATTTIMLNDGETAVIGGIFKISQSDPLTQVPFLGNLPIIGKLFRDQINTRRNEELIIFLTPQIVRSGAEIDDSFGPISVGM